MLEGLAALAKALLYGAMMSAVGATLASAALRTSASIGGYAARVTRLASAASIVLGGASVVLLFTRLGGAFDSPTLAALLVSPSGAALALQVGGAILLLALASGEASAHVWRIVAALVITAAFAINGHAAAMNLAAGLVAMAHFVAAAWWVGSLWLLRRACATAEPEEVVRLVKRFSSLAVPIVAGLVIAGIVLILILVDFSSPHWLTDYVIVLAAKLVFVILLLAAAAYNKFSLTPRLTREEPAIARLRQSIHAELALIGGILTATAVLTTYFSPES